MMPNESEWPHACAQAGRTYTDMIVRSAAPADLERLISLLDQAFIFGKKRTISLRRRFPTVFCGDNLNNLILCLEGDEVVSSLTMRRFDWLDDGKLYHGAMIGAVYTNPQQRGRGLASRLLEAAAGRLRIAGVDFGVLWTTQPAFYERLGWSMADCGVLGEMEIDVPKTQYPGEVVRSPAENSAVAIEAIRRRQMNSTTLRHPDDYRQLPLPADSVEGLMLNRGEEYAGYALAGRAGDTVILYEMGGHPDCFPALWQAACCQCRHILVNERENSPSHRWLSKNTLLRWQPKALAMWLPLSQKMETIPVSQWYIPYFDRI